MNTGECAGNLAKVRVPLVPAVDTPAKMCYIHIRREGNGLAPYIGGDSVTVLETLALLNLLAVVIFGVINVTKKK